MSEEELFREIFEEEPEPSKTLPPLIRKLCKTFEKSVFKRNAFVEDYDVFVDGETSRILFSVNSFGEKFKIATIVNNETLETEKVIYQEILDIDMKTVDKSTSVIRKKINDMKDYYGKYRKISGE